MRIKILFLITLSIFGLFSCTEDDKGTTSKTTAQSTEPCGQSPSTSLTISHTTQALTIDGITATPWNTKADDMSPTIHSGTSTSSFIPQIVVHPVSNGAVVAWNDHAANPARVVLTAVNMSSSNFSATHTPVNSLGELLGMTVDDAGNVYVMTGDGKSASNGDGDGVHADNVTDIQKFDDNLTLLLRESMNLADLDNSKVALRSPGHSGSGRLAYGNGHLGLFFSRQTDQDSQGVIHQANMALKVSTDNLSIVDDGYASGHSWDQRMIYDSRVNDFIGYDLKDTYGRGVIIATPFTTVNIYASNNSYIQTNRAKIYTMKGGKWSHSVPYQWTYTRLGSIQLAKNGYAALFSTENSTTFNDDYITASFNLAFMHVKQDWSNSNYWDDATINLGAAHNNQWVTNDTSLNPCVTALAQEPYLVSGMQWRHENKGMVWLTDYSDKQNEHAQKPKLIKVADGQFLVLWEKWKTSTTATSSNNTNDYINTYAMLVDDYGNLLVGETELGTSARLQPGDDVTVIDGKATWVTGDPDNNALQMHIVQIQ